MLRTTRPVAAVVTGCTMLGLGLGTASASASTTISPLPTQAPIVDKLYVAVPITVVCDPSPFGTFGFSSVTIRQVVRGKEIAHGTSSNPITCDGAAHTYTVNVFPDTTGTPGASDSPPFKKGVAVISATAINFFDPGATAGPQSIKLT